MMDQGDEVPEALIEECHDSIAESLELLKRWHGQSDGRIRYCFAPRFAVSCSRRLLERVAQLSREHGVMIHTHASENRDEIELVQQSTGKRNIEYLRDTGLTAPHVVLAHCIWLDEHEMEILRSTGTHVAHCPSSNLKLASGFARIFEMLEQGISVSLGADGAACNNRLDMFTEMRTAALIQKALRGSQALPALTALRMATIGGARALGLAGEIGSIELGKRADLQLLNLNQIHTTPHPDLISTIVYAAEADDVETVIIDGRVIMRGRELLTLDEEEVISQANSQAQELYLATEPQRH
jgi:5-methylthioadenosine/S-adenosylhomocysteine deaminase